MSDPVWPTRWLDDPEAPPGAQDFVRTIDRPSFVPPPVRRPPPAPPRTRWLGPTLATALVVGGLVVWRLSPAPASGPGPVEETVDATLAAPPPDAPAPLTDAPADAPVDASSAVASTAHAERVPRRTPSDRPPAPAPAPEGTETAESSDGPPGLLSVMTSPASEVTVDGVPVGWTPILRLPLAPGRHTLTFVSGEAGIHETRIVTVRAGEASQLRVSLAAGALGSLNIQTLPWARVLVDGRDTGRNTPVRDLRLPAGRHVLGLRTPDGVLHEEVIDVPAAETLRIVRQF